MMINAATRAALPEGYEDNDVPLSGFYCSLTPLSPAYLSLPPLNFKACSRRYFLSRWPRKQESNNQKETPLKHHESL